MENFSTTPPPKTIPDDLQDFSDVFGGPPRTILSHQLSATGFSYKDIFWQTEKPAPPPSPTRSGRNLPLFKIPSAKQISYNRQKGSFYSDIFGWDSEKFMSSKSRSTTNSSSALSSEELSPLRYDISDDDVSFLASKLRPINVKSRWKKKWAWYENPNSDNEWRYPERKTIAESLKLEQTSFGVSEDDVQFNSPASVVSSDRNALETCDVLLHEEMKVEDDFDEDDELMSIALDSCNRGTTAFESNDVDEAIAWAKEKFHSQHRSTPEIVSDDQLSPQGPTNSSPSVRKDEMSIVDEKIRWWLIGKESDIRWLLYSLHHILWANSGWMAIPQAQLVERWEVKKAYQKAVLCLHPDKLQQRRATLQQKRVAEKAFAALQDAWTTFITLDV